MSPRPVTIVLVGGGHAHVVALAGALGDPPAGCEVVLVARDVLTPYSGMVPGVIAGAYRADEAHIDLLKLTRATGARLIHGSAEGLDRDGRRLLIAGRSPLAYDLLSIDVGITPKTAAIEGASEHATAVKPIGRLLAKIEALTERVARGGVRRIAVVGGGAAGVEVVLALRTRFPDPTLSLTLVTRKGLLDGHESGIGARFTRILAARGVTLVKDFAVAGIAPGGLVSTTGEVVEADEVLLNTEAAAPEWFGATDLARDEDGFLLVGPTLQSLSDPHIFASGDCAAMAETPRPKAGVYAVRQGPILARNLIAMAGVIMGGQPQVLERYQPQTSVLAILASGDGRAVATKGRWSVEGRWVWRWKDHLDRSFMDRIGAAGTPHAPALARRDVGEWPRPFSLTRTPQTSDWPPGVAVIETDNAATVTSVSEIGALLDDPFALGLLAARHALGPVIATGASGLSVSGIIGIGKGAPARLERRAHDLLAGLRQGCDRENAVLGAVSFVASSELRLSLTAGGEGQSAALVGLLGAKIGDVLVLTRPIGAGVMMMADRRGLLTGKDWVTATGDDGAPRKPLAVRLRAAGASAVVALGPLGLGAAASLIAARAGIAASLTRSSLPRLASAERSAALMADDVMAHAGPFADRLVGADPTEAALLLADELAGGFLAAMPPDDVEDRLADIPEAVPIGMLVARVPGIEGAVLMR